MPRNKCIDAALPIINSYETMSKTPELGYEFGGFKLFPQTRILLHGGSRVYLVGKDFDLLCYLVIHNMGIVSSLDLAAAIWGESSKAYARNISHRISRIRKALGCDPTSPTFIKTFQKQKGYKFIAAVTQRESELPFLQNSSEQRSTYQIKCHLFVPLFLGSNLPFGGGSSPQNDLEKVQYERGTLYLNSTGFAVWHLVEKSSFENLWRFANWRKEAYAEILSGKHAINSLTRALLKGLKGSGSWPSIPREPGYVFSAVILDRTKHRNRDLVGRTVELLAIPSLLEASALTPDEIAARNSRERKLLETTAVTKDVTEFGLFDSEIGYASWDSVAYSSLSAESLEQRIVEFEVPVQMLWWMCKCSTEILLVGDRKNVDAVRKWIPDIKRQFAKIRNIGATESPSQRTMREAILKTSRLKEMVDEVLELSQDLAP